jgi:LCP family protein required for cell wall assembly
VRPPSGRPRRTWPQRLLIAFNVVCVLGALTAAGTLAYFNDKFGEITRIQLGADTLREQKERPAGAPINYLLVGADDDTGLGPNDPETRGRGNIAGARTDTIMVLRVDPKDTTARLLSFPRDLWVPISGTNTKARINEAFEGNDGAQRLIDTIKQNFGIPIDHYVQVNFASFKKLVDSIGGVPINFPEPVRAKSSGLDIPTAGCYTLDGTQALAFVRARKDYQVLRDGRWQLDLSGDLGRINRQQLFIQIAIKRAIAKGIRNPATLRRLVELGVKSVAIDQQLRPSDVMDLGQRFRNFNPKNLVKYTLPVDDAVKGAAQVLELRADEAEPILEIFRGQPSDSGAANGTQVELQPEQVRLQVVNGSRIDGQAREVTNELTRVGFIPASPGNTDTMPNTTLRYAPGKVDQARLVARYLKGPVIFEESDQVTATDVVVVTGSDFQGVSTQPKPADQVPSLTTSTSTTTTVPDTTTTSTTLVGELPGQTLEAASC